MRKLLSLPGLLVLLLVLVGGVYWYYSPSGITLRNQYYSTPPEFQKLLKRFQRQQILYEEVAAALPLIHAQQGPKDFSIAMAEKFLGLRKSQVLLRNPFAADTYPLSGSVIYQNNLVALFAPGYFACYKLPDLTRNLAMEQQLNTRQFTYHWVLGGQLVAMAAERYVTFSEGKWEPYAAVVPLSRQPKLFEDDQYVACMKCNGGVGWRGIFL